MMRYEEQRARNETIAVSERARASDRARAREMKWLVVVALMRPIEEEEEE